MGSDRPDLPRHRLTKMDSTNKRQYACLNEG